MSFLFPPGLSTSSLASGDPYAQYRLWRGSLPLSTITITHKNVDPTSTTCVQTTIPIPTHTPSPFYFTYRPPISFAKRTDSQRKSLQRRLLFTSRRRPDPRLISNSRAARIRLWYKEASTRRKQLKTIANIRTSLVRELTSDAERATISLSHFAGVAETLYNISCRLPQSRPLKRPRSSSPDTDSQYPKSPNPPYPLPSNPFSVLGRKRPRSP